MLGRHDKPHVLSIRRRRLDIRGDEPGDSEKLSTPAMTVSGVTRAKRRINLRFAEPIWLPWGPYQAVHANALYLRKHDATSVRLLPAQDLAADRLRRYRPHCNVKRFYPNPHLITSACQSRRSRASANRCRAGADARSSDLDPRSFPSIARSSRRCVPPRKARRTSTPGSPLPSA